VNPWRRHGAWRALSLRGALLILAGAAIALVGIFFAAGDLLLDWLGF